jgi:peptidoglycan/LPS O-acetylase OafA/YrhL
VSYHAAEPRALAGAGHNSNLDILRSIAVLAVFVTHALQVIAGCKFGEYIAYGVETYSLGKIGVMIFFVHTSLVLMQSLSRAEINLSGWRMIRYFYIRRAFRIYPLSISLILVSIAFSIPPNAVGLPWRWYGVRWLLANILLIQNATGMDPAFSSVSSPLWSLPYEVQMYLVLPLLFLVLRAPGWGVRLISIYIIGAVLSLSYPIFLYVPCFLAGVIAYKLLGTVRSYFRAWLWCPAVLGTVALYVQTPHQSWLKDASICLGVAVLIPLFEENSGVIAYAAAQIAKYSYGIYLCHTPILWLLYRKMTIPDWQRPIWLVILTGAASVACYHVIEHPLIRFSAGLANKVHVKPGRLVAVA